MKNKILIGAAIIGGLWLLAYIVSLFFIADSDMSYSSGNVAVIPVRGFISIDAGEGLFVQEIASSESIIEQIDKAEKNPSIKAVLFDINSGGGSPVATDEIAQRIEEMQKPSVSVIREIGASGAYWIASSTDYIYANRMSITGSIGVYGSYLEYSDLLDRFNITYERLTSGKYKDIGTPFKELTPDEREKMQSLLDRMHRFFMDAVAKNRNLSRQKVSEVSTGMVYLGAEAKDLGLIDALGTKRDAVRYIEERYNITAQLVPYTERKTIWDLFGEVSATDLFKRAKFINSGDQKTNINI